MLSSETKVVTYVNKRGERSTYPLNSAMESANLEMVKRLKYTKDILTHMLNQNAGNLNRQQVKSAANGARADGLGNGEPVLEGQPIGQPVTAQSSRPQVEGSGVGGAKGEMMPSYSARNNRQSNGTQSLENLK